MKNFLFSINQKRLIIYLLLFFNLSAAYSQSYNLYTSSHFFNGDTAITSAYKVTYDNSGNAYFTGNYRTENVPSLTTSYGIAIWKVSTAGVTTAKAFYQYSSSGTGDKVVDMKFISGNLYLLVDGKYDAGIQDRDAVLLKYNASLTFQWFRLYDGPGSPDDLPVALEEGSSNNILFLVKSLGDIITLRYNSSGTYLSLGTFNSGFDDTPVTLRHFAGSTYVTGTKDDGAGGRTTLLIKYNLNLAQLWQKTIPVSGSGKTDVINDLHIDTLTNEIYIAGGYNSTSLNPFLVKFNSSGVKLYSHKYGFAGNAAIRVFNDDIGNLILYAGGDKNKYYNLNPADGNANFTVNLFTNTATNFRVMDVQKGSDNNIYAIGDYDSTYATSSGSTTDYGLAIAKIKTNGIRAWQTTIVNSVFRPDLIIHPVAFAVRGNTKVYYIYNRDDISLVPEEYFCGYGMRSTSNGLKLGDEDGTQENISEMNIYPNPAHDIITINCGTDIDGDCSIAIFDVNGKLINLFSGTVSNEMLQLNIENYNSGIYLLKIDNAGKSYSAKFIKAN